MRNIPSRITCLFLIGLVGCNTTPQYNQPLEVFDRNAGYRFENLDTEENSDSLLVILTFSGGGTRATALSLGVLQYLSTIDIEWEGKRTTLLDEVDVISSVSGGSFTAAYYGLFGDRIFEDFVPTLYKKNQSMLMKSAFALPNMAKQASPLYSRTDTTANRYATNLFEGKTYGDLLNHGKRPYIILNATDMGVGQQFSFTQHQFDFIHSDLSSYPVGYAVAASSAFPGAFSALILKNYDPQPEHWMSPWFTNALANETPGSSRYILSKNTTAYLEPEKKFVHLSDGGISDNLGLLPVIRSIASPDWPFGFTPTLQGKKEQKIVIITVNAAKDTGDQLSHKNKPPGLLKLLNTAGSTPLDWFSFAQIEYMRLLGDYVENRSAVDVSSHATAATNAELQRAGKAPRSIHFMEVGFDKLTDPTEAAYFKSIPTKFTLEPESIDRLLAVGEKILSSDPIFVDLIDEIGVNDTE